MIFKVEKLGPVERAEIDLSKDLILLTGPNGTGKTYVAWAVYGFLSSLQEDHFREVVRASIAPTIDQFLSRGNSVLDLSTAARERGGSVLAEATRHYAARLANDFAAERRLFEHSVLHVEPGNRGWWTNSREATFIAESPDWIFTCRWNAGSSELRITAARRKSQNADVNVSQRPLPIFVPVEQLAKDERSSIQNVLADALAGWIAYLGDNPHPHIFPAERIATTIFWRELSLKRAELVDQVLTLWEEPQRAVEHVRREAQRYPRPIRDSLQMAGDLDRWSRNESGFANLAEYIEENLLHGKVRLSSYGELEFVPLHRPEVALGMHITASMVKSLSLLVFYLRHMAQTGDMIIIDEPELNLHPDNQRLIARVLARAVNRGLKVMASTHSDYLMRELNNLIMLGQDKEEIRALRAKHGYEEAELLKPEQLGVYLFQNHTAEVVPVDETGFAVATIDDEINKLNAVSQEIYAALLEQEP